MKALFFVTAPIEMLSAIEARKHFKIKESILVLFTSKVDLKIIKYLIKESKNWTKIIIRTKENYYGYYWISLIKKLNKNKFDFLFTAINTTCSHFLFNLNFKKHFFIDDGTLSIVLNDYYNKNNNITNKISLFEGRNKFGFKYRLIKIVHLAFKHKLFNIHEKADFFTMFNFVPKENQIIIKNNFDWFKLLTNKSEIFNISKNTIYVIGTALVTDTILSMKDYCEYLTLIKQKFPSKKLIYIVHRRETEKQLSVIKNQCNFEIQKNKYLIEIDFLIKNLNPSHIVGTISTALYTLKMLYGDSIQVDAIKLDSEKFIKRKEDFKIVLESQNNYVDTILE